MGEKRHPRGRGLHSFSISAQLELFYHNTFTVEATLTHECVLELLKLSSNLNECKPLPRGPMGGKQP